MPLYPGALELIRRNLEWISEGRRAPLITIGYLTEAQLDALNRHRSVNVPDFEPVEAEVVFIGRHTYNSRIRDQGYTIQDVLDMIAGAMDSTAVFNGGLPMQTMRNPSGRADRYGNRMIHDTAVFECRDRKPFPELFSVIPKGDHKKPQK